MSDMEMVIGLEVHAQLGTRTKLFCACESGAFGKAANSAICPVCTGQPGVLPVLNRLAVELGFMAAMALDCRLRARSVFARKNYFYPDLPKGYQVSQFEEPFSENGSVELRGGGRIGITRIHLEEDAGKLNHQLGGKELAYSLVDFNRAGTPLIEIVSEPDLRSPEDAYEYLGALKSILQYCGVSRCDMEKGELRCDANVSVRPKGREAFGTKVEIKNLNSFKAVREALAYEYKRQCAAVDGGEKIVQETRLWNVAKGKTEPMRLKEEAHDYRYFPEPDLVPVIADELWVRKVRAELPELPSARRARFQSDYALSAYDAGVLTAERGLADYFESVIKEGGEAKAAKAVSNWIQSVLMAKLNENNLPISEAKVSPDGFAELIGLVGDGTLSRASGKVVFENMWDTGKTASALVSELGLQQVSDSGELAAFVEEAIQANPKAVADLKAGKKKAAGAIVGFVMKKTKGKANPALVNKLISEKLK
ncbi:MAG: Asp-tRNA(Asn)/Glu-tRNA(Gln) amidotransferase subunit GatB [Elusimicrobiota bacterium]